LRDIIDGKVDINDVLIIIAGTDFNPHIDIEWDSIWKSYHSSPSVFSSWNYPVWGSCEDADEQRFRDLTIELYDSGRIHQPRKFGSPAVPQRATWLEAILLSSELENNAAAKIAWEHFQTVAGLTNVTIDRDYK